MPANLENSTLALGLEKVSFHSSSKECLNYCITALISHASKVMLKILQARLPHGTENFQMFKLDWEKAEELEIKLPTSVGSSKKQENSRKMSTSASLTMPKCLTVWITTNSGNSSDGNTRSRDLPLEKSVHRSRSNSKKGIWHNGLVPNWERSMLGLYIVNLLI